jgi:hypothetical protein
VDWTKAHVDMPRPPPSDISIGRSGSGATLAASSRSRVNGGSSLPAGRVRLRRRAQPTTAEANAVTSGQDRIANPSIPGSCSGVVGFYGSGTAVRAGAAGGFDGGGTAAQVLLHQTLVALTTQVPGDMAGQMSAASTSAMGGHAIARTDGWSVTMTAAHVVATLVTALLLARGEQALWQLVSRLLPTLPCIPRLLACVPRQAPVLLSVPALRPSLVSGGSGLRGPPARS